MNRMNLKRYENWSCSTLFNDISISANVMSALKLEMGKEYMGISFCPSFTPSPTEDSDSKSFIILAPHMSWLLNKSKEAAFVEIAHYMFKNGTFAFSPMNILCFTQINNQFLT